MIKKKILLSSAVAMMAVGTSFGAGFQLNLQGLRQLAMGGTGTGWHWDAASVFYNPGAMGRMTNVQLYGGVVFLVPHTQYIQSPTGGYEYRSQSQTFTPFNLYVAGPIKKDSKVSLGLGVYTPFGSGLKWDDNWVGRYMSQNISLQAIFVQPTVAYRFSDKLSLGLGLIYAHGAFKAARAIPVMDLMGNEGQANLSGNGNGFGVNIGLHAKFSESVQAGITYRSGVQMKVKSGKAEFSVPSSLSSNFPNTTFSSELPLPAVVNVGVGVKATEHLTINLDLNFVNWKTYDSLVFDYATNTASLEDTREPRLYKNKLVPRIGANYDVNGKLGIMLGGAYDPTPVADGYVSPDLPDGNRLVFTGGLSYKFSDRFSIIGAFEYVSSEKRESIYKPGNFAGTYQTKAFNPGIAITYDFK